MCFSLVAIVFAAMFTVSQVPLHRDAWCLKHHYQEMHNESLANFRSLFTVTKGPLDVKLQPVLFFLKQSIVSAFAALEETRCTCSDGSDCSGESMVFANIDDYSSDGETLRLGSWASEGSPIPTP